MTLIQVPPLGVSEHCLVPGRLGQARFGQVWLSQVIGQVRLGQIWLGLVWSSQGQVRLGQVRFSQVRFGQVRLGQVRGQGRNPCRKKSAYLGQFGFSKSWYFLTTYRPSLQTNFGSAPISFKCRHPILMSARIITSNYIFLMLQNSNQASI